MSIPKLSRMRWSILALSVYMIMMGGILLLNVTAKNPTGRRYSSQAVDLTLPVPEKGKQGEDILGADLGIETTNERSDQTTCVCNSSFRNAQPPNQCTVCAAFSESIINYRIPDFVSASFIAESKNAQRLLTVYRDFDQATEMAAAAQELDIPLWIFVRTDTMVDREYRQLARDTGGDVIYYFRDDTYFDPMDGLAKILILLGVSGIVVVLGWEAVRRVRANIDAAYPADPENTSDEIDDARDVVNETEDYMRRIERLSRKEIDKKNDNNKKR